MKEKSFVVNIVEGTEFESVTVRDLRGRLLYAGNKADFLSWFDNCMEETPSESKSNS